MNWSNIADGGVIGYLIILIGIFAIALFVERLLYYRKEKSVLKLIESDLLSALEKGDISEAKKIVDNSNSIVAKIYSELILEVKGDVSLKERLQEIAAVEVPYLWKNLNVLSLIVSIAPLLGLLGTVLGMLQSFQEIESLAKLATGAYGPGVVAGGIKKALVTTILGLMVAIPVNVAYGYLTGAVEKLTLQIEKTSYEIISIITSKKGSTK